MVNSFWTGVIRYNVIRYKKIQRTKCRTNKLLKDKPNLLLSTTNGYVDWRVDMKGMRIIIRDDRYPIVYDCP